MKLTFLHVTIYSWDQQIDLDFFAWLCTSMSKLLSFCLEQLDFRLLETPISQEKCKILS